MGRSLRSGMCVSMVALAWVGCRGNAVSPDDRPMNHAPVAQPLPDAMVEIGATLQLQLNADDPDGQTLHWRAVDIPTTATFDAAHRLLRWTPQPVVDVGTHTAIFSVTDDGVPPLTDAMAVRITVTDHHHINRVPVFVSVPTPAQGRVDACAPLQATFGVQDPDGDLLTFFSPDLPSGAQLYPERDQVRIEWTPTAAQAGHYAIPIYAVDGGTPSMSSAVVFNVEVIAPNPLHMDPIAPMDARGGDTVHIPIPDAHPCYTLTATPMPTGASWHAGEKQLIWLTAPTDLGIYDLQLQLTDADMSHVQQTVRVVIHAQEDATTMSGFARHDVLLGTCCAGTARYDTVPELRSSEHLLLQSQTDDGTVLQSRLIRMYNKSLLPLGGFNYTLRARDTVDGTFCSSGGLLEVYTTSLDHPERTWPHWDTVLDAAATIDIPNGQTLTTLTGTVTFTAPTQAFSVVLRHADQSDTCDLNVYWDHIQLIPFLTPTTPQGSAQNHGF